jgi:hypothetical protein
MTAWLHYIPEDVGTSLVGKLLPHFASRRLSEVKHGDIVWLYSFEPGSRSFEVFGRIEVRAHRAPEELVLRRDARAMKGEFLVEAHKAERCACLHLGPRGAARVRLLRDLRPVLRIEDEVLFETNEVTEATSRYLEERWAEVNQQAAEREREELRWAPLERGQGVLVQTPYGAVMITPDMFPELRRRRRRRRRVALVNDAGRRTE